jgi:hypothetical protein
LTRRASRRHLCDIFVIVVLEMRSEQGARRDAAVAS